MQLLAAASAATLMTAQLPVTALCSLPQPLQQPQFVDWSLPLRCLSQVVALHGRWIASRRSVRCAT